MEYAASSDRKSGRLEMCEVVDSRSANRASTEAQNKDFTYLDRHGDSNMTITRQSEILSSGSFFKI